MNNLNFFICVDDYISVDDCKKYIDIYYKNLNNIYSYGGEVNGESYPLGLIDSDLISKIRSSFNIDYTLDKLEIVKRESGSYMGMHVDKNDKLAFIIYLNDDYVGGETIIGNTMIKPKIGRILVFTNGTLPHAVSKVENGERFVMLGWFV